MSPDRVIARRACTAAALVQHWPRRWRQWGPHGVERLVVDDAIIGQRVEHGEYGRRAGRLRMGGGTGDV